MKKIFAGFTQMLVCLLMLCAHVDADARTFNHPGVTYTKADILRMKAEIAAQADPYYTVYQALLKSTYVTRAASTTAITNIDGDDNFNTKLGLPGRCALDNALLYQLTGDESYATKAIAWLNDLSHITTLTASTAALSCGKVELLIEAAELMRDYEGWAATDKARFDAMLKDVFYPQLKNFDRARWGNQGLTAARAIIAMGVYLDNEGMYDHAYRYLTRQPRSAADTDSYPLGKPIRGSRTETSTYMYTFTVPTTYGTDESYYDECLYYYILDNGQCSESSRDQGHAQYGINLYGNIAEIAWNQGDDLYGKGDKGNDNISNRILLGFEWTYRYNLDTSWTPTGYTGKRAQVSFSNGRFLQYYTQSQRWKMLRPYEGDRGNDYSSGLNREMVLAHYKTRVERPSSEYTYLQQSVDNMISKYGYEQGDVTTGGHYYEFPGWGTLTKRRQTWMVGDPVVSGEYAMHTIGEAINFGDVDNFKLGNSGHTMSGVTVSGTGISAITKDGWASYTVNVAKAGTYAMKVTYTADNATSLAVASDGGDYTTGTLAAAGASTEATLLTDLHYDKGLHVIRIKATEASTAALASFQLELTQADAETIDYSHPVTEYNYRPKADGSGWEKNLLGTATNSTNNFECRYGSRLLVIQQYQLRNFNKNRDYIIKLHKNGNSGELAVWDYAAALPNSASECNTQCAKVTGVTPGSTDGTNAKDPITSATCTSGVWTFVIPGTSLTPVSTDADGTATVNLLITTKDLTSSTTTNAYFYTYNTNDASIGDANYPTVTNDIHAVAEPIQNLTTKTKYSSLATAVSEAAANDVLELSYHVTLSDRLEIDKNITIKGANNEVRIIRDASKDIVTILNKADATIQNIIIDGQGIDRQKAAIESSVSGKTLTLKDVTIQNYSNLNSASGIIQLKTNGKLVADGLTMKECYVQDGYGCIFVGSKDAMTLKGDNGSCGSIYDESSFTIDASEATNTSPMTVKIGTVTEGSTIINGTGDQSKFTLLNDGYKWLTVGASLKIAKPTVSFTVKEAGCATFVLPFDAALPGKEEEGEEEGEKEAPLKAYTLTVSDGKIAKAEVTTLTANKPVYIEGTAATYTFTATGNMVQGEDPVNGALHGVWASQNAPVDSYVLQKKSGDSEAYFYHVASGSQPTIGAYRAYLVSDPSAARGIEKLYFEEGEIAGISQIEAGEQRIENSAAYTLSGQHINSVAGYKGIVIVNGKKYLQK